MEVLDYLTLDEELRIKIRGLLTELQEGKDVTLSSVGHMLENALTMYAGNEITKSELEEIVRDAIDLQLANYHGKQVDMKVKIEKYANMATKLIIEQLLKLV